MLAQELSERDHANRSAISAEILEQVPATAVLLSSDEAHCHISGAAKKLFFYVLFRNIHNLFLDSFFHFLYIFKMWEIFMPHPVLSHHLRLLPICRFFPSRFTERRFYAFLLSTIRTTHQTHHISSFDYPNNICQGL